MPQGSVWHFNPVCKDCEQKEANERKNDDRALTIIRRRCADHASKAGVPSEFVWVKMNYQALVPIYRAMSSSEGRCLSCGHKFDNERDIQIEHRSPPRHAQDWARLHARNLGFQCGNCNGTKTNKGYELWLDEQEECRLSNERHPANGPVRPPVWEQLRLV